MQSSKQQIVLTGARPTGPLHIGHYAGALRQQIQLQKLHKQFVIIADVQALTDNFADPQKVHDNILEITLDYIAVGIDPSKSTIFIQSLIPEIAELTIYYLNLVTIARLERNPTVKDEIKQKKFGASIPAGFFVYPISQAADITAFKSDLIPVGNDQLPMIEQTAEIVRKFNHTYDASVLVEPKPLLSEFPRLPGTDGKNKMSKSLGNTIYLKDDEKTIRQKIKSMYTDPNHLRVEDSGQVEGNPVFAYLDAFDNNKTELEELKEHYKRGGLGDTTVKNRLTEIILNELAPIRRLREELAKDPAEIMRILKKGTEDARQTAAQTLSEVKKAMRIDYFS